MNKFFKKLLPIATNIIGTRLLNKKTPIGLVFMGLGAFLGVEVGGVESQEVSTLLSSVGLVNPIINNVITYGERSF